jgi:hypothetical protein
MQWDPLGGHSTALKTTIGAYDLQIYDAKAGGSDKTEYVGAATLTCSQPPK